MMLLLWILGYFGAGFLAVLATSLAFDGELVVVGEELVPILFACALWPIVVPFAAGHEFWARSRFSKIDWATVRWINIRFPKR